MNPLSLSLTLGKSPAMKRRIMSKTPLLVLAGLLTFTLLLVTGTAAEHTTDSLDTVRKNLDAKKAVLLDVREQEEWDDGHLADAKLLPLSRLTSGVEAAEVEKIAAKGKVIYCHCGSGFRVIAASKALEKLGYEVRPLKHGYRALIEAGFPKADQ